MPGARKRGRPRKVRTVTTTTQTTKPPAYRSRILRKVIKGYHYFRRCTGSENMQINALTATAGGAISVSNAGMLTLTTAITGATQYFGWTPTFTLKDVPDYSEFTTLFDKYKILRIDIKFYPAVSCVDAQIAGGNSNAGMTTYLHSVTDYDDGVAFPASLAGVNSMREYETHKLNRLLKPVTYKVRPRLSLLAYQGVVPGYVQNRTAWVDCDTNAYYYGKKFMFEVVVPDAHVYFVNIKTDITYHLALKDVR